ncbi:MAG: nucleotide-diphospho-sugar transferase [Flavobacteriales bacterium]|nr:hypothetical protein [Flavobacteriales bacterium]MCB9166042.1 nucleotide-diphospho-sugar transferase [Flavobacteriales bacterium]
MNQDKERKGTDVPVLLTAFVRYDTANQVMEALRKIRPARLYFACDGPRNAEDVPRCEKVRSLVELVDWDCDLHTRFSAVNRTSKQGMFEAISWFFEHEEAGIILEDDIVPSPSFFPFCEELLHRYASDERVWAIIGNNLMTEWPVKGDDSYYFSEHGYGAYWGWASWRRVWRKFDLDMKDWPHLRDSGLLDGFFRSAAEKREAMVLLERTWDGRIPTAWDYQFDYGRVTNHALNIIPNVNLARNIGFGELGTHTVKSTDPRNKEELHEVTFPLVHPRFMMVDQQRDMEYFRRYIRTPYFRLFKDAVKKALPQPVSEVVTPVLSKLQRRLGID